jgi:hypothetical protein
MIHIEKGEGVAAGVALICTLLVVVCLLAGMAVALAGAK